jgi:hypothetical protein
VRLFKRCDHANIRCIHGDEINAYIRWRRPSIARAFCLDCNRPLFGHDLPAICTETQHPHFTETRRIA